MRESNQLFIHQMCAILDQSTREQNVQQLDITGKSDVLALLACHELAKLYVLIK